MIGWQDAAKRICASRQARQERKDPDNDIDSEIPEYVLSQIRPEDEKIVSLALFEDFA